MKRVVVVQARTGSSRLPGKVLLPLQGKPVLARQLERMKAAKYAFDLVVATTTDPADDPIVDVARSEGVACFRGHPTDLLDRHLMAARAHGADTVVKIPSDCPLIDPRVIDRVLAFDEANAGSFDFVSNLQPPTYPDGNDVEVMTIGALETAWREADKPFQREHTTPFLWDQPERFRCANVAWETGLHYADAYRFTIDYPEDYEFIRAVYAELHNPLRTFSLDDILDLLARRPDIRELNAAYCGVTWMRKHAAELRTIHG
jgi:spore coat polysaccharide biosynthesis protein SpsF